MQIGYGKVTDFRGYNGSNLGDIRGQRRGGKRTQNCTKKIFMAQIIMMV